MRATFGALIIAAALLAAPSAGAQNIGAASDTTRFVLDTSLMLAAGLGAIVIVIGFCLRDIGLARIQNAPAVCLRTLGLLAVTAAAFWLVGFNLLYAVEEGGLLGEFAAWAPDDVDPMANGHASGAFWFFQMGLAAIAAAIVSGAVSERVRLWPFLMFTAAFTGVIYPIAASWVWGGGYFDQSWSFYDFGGAAVIHMTAGAAAVAAAIVVGPRPGRYDADAGRPSRSTALPLSAVGVGFVWVASLVVMAGMGESLSSVEAAITIGTVTANTTLAAAGGVMAAIFLTQIVYRRAGLVTGFCGAIGGIVSIAADPLHPALWQAAMIGAVGGMIVTVAPPFLDRYRIDDAGFVIPAHLLCGGWGAIIVAWTNPEAWAIGQIAGITGLSTFAFFMSLLIWVALKYTIGVRQKFEGEVSAAGRRELRTDEKIPG